MNIGAIYAPVKSEVQSGKIVLKTTNLKKQENYKERHKDDFSSKSVISRVFDTFKPAIILCAIFLFIFKVILMNGFIPSQSMDPTLKVGDGIIVNRLAYSDGLPSRGDIIVFTSDEYDGEYLIKRVVGLPGDAIDLKGGSVYVNNCRLIESYAYGETLDSPNGVTHFEVPEGKVFLLGDNREGSADARWWKNPYIDKGDIIGKAVFQYSLAIFENGLYANKVVSVEPTFVNDVD